MKKFYSVSAKGGRANSIVVYGTELISSHVVDACADVNLIVEAQYGSKVPILIADGLVEELATEDADDWEVVGAETYPGIYVLSRELWRRQFGLLQNGRRAYAVNSVFLGALDVRDSDGAVKRNLTSIAEHFAVSTLHSLFEKRGLIFVISNVSAIGESGLQTPPTGESGLQTPPMEKEVEDAISDVGEDEDSDEETLG